jgi:hypothetical protein
MMKVKTCVGVALSLLVGASTSQAFVDPSNLLAPGLAARDLSVQIVVRHPSTGSIWAKNLQPTMSTWFNTPGSPPMGSSTGPQVVFVGQSGTVWWLTRGPFPDDRIWVKRGANWDATTFGRPPAPTTFGFAGFSAYADKNNGVSVVSLDTNNRPWFKQVSATGAVIMDWFQFPATNTVAAAPGVAVNFTTGKPSVFGALATADLEVSVCVFANCFNTWNPILPGVFGASNTGITGASFLSPGASGSVFTTAALLGTDNRVYWTQDIGGGGYDTWHQRGTATADSQPAAAYFSQAFSNEPALAVHRPDGNYYVSWHGTTWTNIGHP